METKQITPSLKKSTHLFYDVNLRLKWLTYSNIRMLIILFFIIILIF